MKLCRLNNTCVGVFLTKAAKLIGWKIGDELEATVTEYKGKQGLIITKKEE